MVIFLEMAFEKYTCCSVTISNSYPQDSAVFLNVDMDWLLNLGFLLGLHPFAADIKTNGWKYVYFLSFNLASFTVILYYYHGQPYNIGENYYRDVSTVEKLPLLVTYIAILWSPANRKKTLLAANNLLKNVAKSVSVHFQSSGTLFLFSYSVISIIAMVVIRSTTSRLHGPIRYIVLLYGTYRKYVFIEYFRASLELTLKTLKKLSKHEFGDVWAVQHYNNLLKSVKMLNEIYSPGILMASLDTFFHIAIHLYFIIHYLLKNGEFGLGSNQIYLMFSAFQLFSFLVPITASCSRLNNEVRLSEVSLVLI